MRVIGVERVCAMRPATNGKEFRDGTTRSAEVIDSDGILEVALENL
jgi:hypothetical protein